MTKNKDFEFCWNGKETSSLLAQSLFFAPHVQFSSGHHILIGDNLNALQALVASEKRFHFIYIDPPYNTGQLFTFTDKQAKKSSEKCDGAAWLRMMFPRLQLAHKVMTDDGIIFVSIDDREIAATLMMLYEIFGKENHLGTLKWRKKRKPSFLDKHLSSTIEYILVFAKNGDKTPGLIGEKSVEISRPVLNAGNKLSERILRAGRPAECADGLYDAGHYNNRTLSIELLNTMEVRNGAIVADVSVKGQFRVTQEILDSTVYVTKNFGLRRIVLESEMGHKNATDNCTDWPTNEDAEAEMRAVFGSRIFDFPKPVGMLKKLLQMCPTQGREPLMCLDFFAGSGTLAEAVLAVNSEDNKDRIFYCAQSDEKLNQPNKEHQLETISDICVARIKNALKKYTPLEEHTLKIIHLTPAENAAP